MRPRPAEPSESLGKHSARCVGGTSQWGCFKCAEQMGTLCGMNFFAALPREFAQLPRLFCLHGLTLTLACAGSTMPTAIGSAGQQTSAALSDANAPTKIPCVPAVTTPYIAANAYISARVLTAIQQYIIKPNKAEMGTNTLIGPHQRSET